MGGGKELFDKDAQISKASSELDEVKFHIYFPATGNQSLFNSDEIYQIFCNEVSDYLKSNGIKNSNIGPVGTGGGGSETFKEITKILLSNFDIIGFLIVLWEKIKSYFNNRISNNIYNLKPRINITFLIVFNSDVDKAEIDILRYMLSNRLANMLYLIDGICSLLINNHKFLNCDCSIEGNIKSKDYFVRFNLPHEYRNDFNYSRLLRIIKDLKIITSIGSEYNFTKWLVIKRSDSKVIKSKDYIKHLQNYYLIFSTRILSDFTSTK